MYLKWGDFITIGVAEPSVTIGIKVVGKVSISGVKGIWWVARIRLFLIS